MRSANSDIPAHFDPDGEALLGQCAKRRASLKGRVQQPLPMAFEPQNPLPNGWTWGSVSQLCERVSVGHVGPTSEHFCDDHDAVLLIRSQNVRPGLVDFRHCIKITKHFHDKLKKSQLQNGDVLIVRVGANRSDTASLKGQSGPINCANIVFARPFFPNGFLSYYLQSPTGRDTLLSLSTGAAQGVINTTAVASMPVPVPPFRTQQRIASILSAYDDLIENNTCRVAILEEMARRLYEEWFVHFRFPGHEEAEFDGDLPRGWSVEKLSNIASVNPEAIKPKTAPERINYIDIASVSPGRINAVQELEFADAPGRARRRVIDGDVIWSCVRPNRRSHALVLEPADNTVASTGFAVLRAREAPFSFLLASVTTDAFVDYLTNHATGAAYPAVKQSDFEAAELVLPERQLVEAFDRAIEPMLRFVHTLDQTNANLRAQRDLLLPKLVSGEIDVTATENVMEAAE